VMEHNQTFVSHFCGCTIRRANFVFPDKTNSQVSVSRSDLGLFRAPGSCKNLARHISKASEIVVLHAPYQTAWSVSCRPVQPESLHV